MTESNAPRIEFPCAYPIKVMGFATASFGTDVVDTVKRHAPEVSDDDVSVRPSRQGNYVAITVTIEATGLAQLEELFQELKTLPDLKMVL